MAILSSLVRETAGTDADGEGGTTHALYGRALPSASPPLKKPPRGKEEEWRKVGMPCMGIMSARNARLSTQIKE